MAIVGHGIDIVDVARFGAKLEGTPALRDRLLTPAEQTPPRELYPRPSVVQLQAHPALPALTLPVLPALSSPKD